ncbi:hypothetical protein J5226_23415 [Lysobacter sp. K5869]|uniref:hypothetical protein n=1 Tax=Lysobacter sp. K5869 TaxID=2820808 RepID=UPI001C05FCD5|nr:hypothetical protein [Lysobacter sp. K5869]QWP76494.1 hypothetical protein J5226_23415 [Lysobacter sp. K5869]
MNAPAADTTAATDASHLQVLSIFYYILAALGALSLPVAGVMAAVMLNIPNPNASVNFPEGRAYALGLLALLVAVNVAFGVVSYLAAQRLRQRRGRKLCQIAAALTCLSFPLGTVLGVFTFVVLNRPSVRAAFDAPR